MQQKLKLGCNVTFFQVSVAHYTIIIDQKVVIPKLLDRRRCMKKKISVAHNFLYPFGHLN